MIEIIIGACAAVGAIALAACVLVAFWSLATDDDLPNPSSYVLAIETVENLRKESSKKCQHDDEYSAGTVDGA